MLSLVVYYTLDGNTEFIAKKIANQLSADIIKLKPKKDISNKGFSKYFWGGKQVIFKELPELESINIDINKYNLIIIGSPIWAGSYTPAVHSFLKMYDFDSKKVGIFCCHDGSKGKYYENMRKNLLKAKIIAETEFEKTSKNRELRGEEAVKWADHISLILKKSFLRKDVK